MDISNNIGVRQNNPGNLKDPTTGAFRTFTTPEEGHQALINDLKIKQSGQSTHIKPGASLEDFANVWAPASDNNNPKSYAQKLASFLGVPTAYAYDQVPTDKLAGAIKVAEGTTALPDDTSTETPTQPTYTKAELLENINAMEAQGATQEEIQGYLDGLGKQPQTSALSFGNQLLSRVVSPGPQPNPSGTGLNLGGTPNFKVEGGTSESSNTGTLQDLGNVGKGLISGTVASGQDIAAAIGGNTMAKAFSALPEADQNYLSTLIQLRNKAALAKDQKQTDHFNKLIKSSKTTDGESITDVFPALNKSTEQVLGDFASMALETVGAADAATGLVGLAGGGAKLTAEEIAAQANKSFGQKLLGGMKTGAKFGGAFGVAGAMENNASGEDIVKSGLIGAGTGAIVGAGTTAVGEGLGKVFSKGLNPEEIAQVKPEDVKNLSPREQKEWHTQNAKTSIEAAKAAGEQSVVDAKAKITDMSTQLADMNEQKRVALKEPFKQLMRDSSQEYVSLTGEAVKDNPNLTKTITNESLASKIDSKFEGNPEIATSLKQDLGIEAPSSTPLPEGEAPKPQTSTNQELLDKAREIMAGVSKSAKTGGSTYSSAEYEAMKKYSFLMETLGENGVDMTEANKFWREWAPVRDRGVKSIQPFDDSNVKKGSLGSTLNKATVTPSTPAQAAAKLDAQNFVKELETRLKMPKGSLTSETQDLMDQLEKAKVSKADANKVATKVAKQIAEESRQAKWKVQSIVERNKRIAKIVGYTLGTLGITGVTGKILESTVPK